MCELLGHPTRTISSQALQGEGSTTIPKGSTAKRLEAHIPSIEGEDIVSSAWQHAAALTGGAGLASQCEDQKLGEYNGVILHESTRIPGWDSGVNTSGTRKAVLCGAQAACFGTGRRDSGTQMKWTEELFDYENQLGVSASMIWGLKKSVYNSIDFATIVCPTMSADPA